MVFSVGRNDSITKCSFITIERWTHICMTMTTPSDQITHTHNRMGWMGIGCGCDFFSRHFLRHNCNRRDVNIWFNVRFIDVLASPCVVEMTEWHVPLLRFNFIIEYIFKRKMICTFVRWCVDVAVVSVRVNCVLNKVANCLTNSQQSVRVVDYWLWMPALAGHSPKSTLFNSQLKIDWSDFVNSISKRARARKLRNAVRFPSSRGH